MHVHEAGDKIAPAPVENARRGEGLATARRDDRDDPVAGNEDIAVRQRAAGPGIDDGHVLHRDVHGLRLHF